jgi:hypothetical protein
MATGCQEQTAREKPGSAMGKSLFPSAGVAGCGRLSRSSVQVHARLKQKRKKRIDPPRENR